MAIAIYCRVSTEEQRERQSIRTQLEFGERYCELHKLPVYRVYSDDGVSGTVPLERRPEGSQILYDAARGRFNQLLIYKLDRLGRETRLILNGVAELEKLGVRIRSMTEEFDTGTSTGRLMLTLLSGFASHERDVIRERCIAGMVRAAAEGGWLGGIVPYGYRRVGTARTARLNVCEDPIPGSTHSEAEVIRQVFNMAAVDHYSCRRIADRLNRLLVPCAYARDGRKVLRSGRKQETAGIWRAGRIRELLTNTTYKGVHVFGKRSSSGRNPVTRQVPGIVTPEIWQQAQKISPVSGLFDVRDARSRYLLRGLIKCKTCGLGYVGTTKRPSGRTYYRCNNPGHSFKAGTSRHRCDSLSVRGDALEHIVWTDIEAFLRNPGTVIQQLQEKLASTTKTERQSFEEPEIAHLLSRTAEERKRLLSLYRRGRIDDADLDNQLDDIAKEESSIRAQMLEVTTKNVNFALDDVDLSSAEALLLKLRERLDQSVSWECKRQVIETLVSAILIETSEEYGIRYPKVTVTYRFEKPNELNHLILRDAPLRSMTRIPVNPETLGDHLRIRRLELKLLQKNVAEEIDVDIATIGNWERNLTQPRVADIPTIIKFLGFNPLSRGLSPGQCLAMARKSRGLTQNELGEVLGVDRWTLGSWEKDARQPVGKMAIKVASFIESR